MIKPGLYKHFKGRLYVVIGVALSMEEDKMVVCRDDKGTLWCIPEEEFQSLRFELVREINAEKELEVVRQRIAQLEKDNAELQRELQYYYDDY